MASAKSRWRNTGVTTLVVDDKNIEPGETFIGLVPRAWIRSGSVRKARGKEA